MLYAECGPMSLNQLLFLCSGVRFFSNVSSSSFGSRLMGEKEGPCQFRTDIHIHKPVHTHSFAPFRFCPILYFILFFLSIPPCFIRIRVPSDARTLSRSFLRPQMHSFISLLIRVRIGAPKAIPFSFPFQYTLKRAYPVPSVIQEEGRSLQTARRAFVLFVPSSLSRADASLEIEYRREEEQGKGQVWKSEASKDMHFLGYIGFPNTIHFVWRC